MPGTQPDLTGLSCRWSHIRARNGTILSVVIQPVEAVPGPEFARLADRVLAIAHKLERDGHPIPVQGAGVRWPPGGVGLEARASRGGGPLGRRRLKLLFETLLAWFFLRTGIPVGGFDPRQYRRAVGRNADFRKFDDGLKMTLDCDPATLSELRSVLRAGREAGIVDFGLYEQDEAMMTCIVPSALSADHVHFVDGASGGYAEAAARIRPA